MNREDQINRFFGGRSFNVIATLVFIVAIILNMSIGYDVKVASNGWCLPSCGLWLDQGGLLSTILNAACIIAVGYMLKYLNRLHGFIRANAAISLSIFLLLEIATHWITSNFYE